MSEQVGNAQVAPESTNVQDAVMNSSNDFFESLDREVNGGILDEPTQSTSVSSDNTQSSPNVEVQPQDDNEVLQKRYSDSSREAKRLNGKLKEIEPYMPILDAMREDPNLISHVRNYFEGGGQAPQSMNQQLNLDEDFVFDPDEMVSNPDSDSRKVFDNMVTNIVNKKTNEIVSQQQAQQAKARKNESVKKQAADFMQRHGMTQDEFQAFASEAQNRIRERGITFDDMYAMINQNQVNANVASATKKDMINQMKNVRDIPTSVSGANNAGKSNDQNDNVFNALLNSDGNIEELLG